MVGDLLDEHVGDVGDDDPGRGRGLDIDHVHPDAADADDHAAFQRPDDLLVDADAPGGDDGVQVAGGGGELGRGVGVDLDDVGDRGQRLQLMGPALLGTLGGHVPREPDADSLPCQIARHRAAPTFRGVRSPADPSAPSTIQL